MTQYSGVGFFVILEATNAISWGTLLFISAVSAEPVVLGPPVVAVFLFVGFLHGTLNLVSSSTASLALLFIPLYAVPIACVTAVGAAGVAALVRWRRDRAMRHITLK